MFETICGNGLIINIVFCERVQSGMIKVIKYPRYIENYRVAHYFVFQNQNK